MQTRLAGLLVPMLTRFREDFSVDVAGSVEYCQRLLQQGADGVVLFGTTGEANSMTAAERNDLLMHVCRAGVPVDRLMVGVGGCALPETIQCFRAAAEQGVAGVLLLPPFFYKPPVVQDEGLYEYVSAVASVARPHSTSIYLYHIPQVAQLGWSFDLIERLATAFPETVKGIKDSTGKWEHTRELLNRFPDLDVFPGMEFQLVEALRAGAVGCITATGNINSRGIKAIFDHSGQAKATELQERAIRVRHAVQAAGTPISMMKACHALQDGDDSWRNVRPPLLSADKSAAADLLEQLSAINAGSDGG